MRFGVRMVRIGAQEYGRTKQNYRLAWKKV
nr:MAG TPA: hypothetical protein [Caudoviricetes sp.]